MQGQSSSRTGFRAIPPTHKLVDLRSLHGCPNGFVGYQHNIQTMLQKHDIMILYIIFQLFQGQCQNIQNPGPRGTFCDYVGPQEENQFPWQVYNANQDCPLWVFTVMGSCNWSSYVCMCAFAAGTISLQAFLLPSYSEGHIIIVDSLLPVPLTGCSERLQSINTPHLRTWFS